MTKEINWADTMPEMLTKGEIKSARNQVGISRPGIAGKIPSSEVRGKDPGSG
jgi:hypothetical protein